MNVQDLISIQLQHCFKLSSSSSEEQCIHTTIAIVDEAIYDNDFAFS